MRADRRSIGADRRSIKADRRSIGTSGKRSRISHFTERFISLLGSTPVQYVLQYKYQVNINRKKDTKWYTKGRIRPQILLEN